MPTALTPVATWRDSLARPNPGEPATIASLLLFLDELADRDQYLYEHHLRGNFQVEKYGAVGSGAVDDYPAFLAARNAAQAAGGGLLRLTPGKSYRLDTELALDEKVGIVGEKGRSGFNDTRLIRNHSGSLLNINGFSTTQTPTLLSGFRAESNGAGADPLIDVVQGSVSLERLDLVGFNSEGPMVRMAGGSDCWAHVNKCSLRPGTGQNAILHELGQLAVAGSQFKVPNTYSSPLVNINSSSGFDPAIGLFSGNYFDASDSASGASVAINMSGSSWAVAATGNKFRTNSQIFAAFAWAALVTSRQLVETGNTFLFAQRHSPAGAPLDFGEELSLRAIQRTTISGTTSTIPTSLRTFICASTNATPPTFTMPAMLYAGQRLRVIVYNISGGTWGSQPNFTGAFAVSGISLPNLNNGQTLVLDFEVADIASAGTYFWYIVRSSL